MNELFRLKINYLTQNIFFLFEGIISIFFKNRIVSGSFNTFPVDQYDDINDGCVWQPLGMWLNPAAKITSFSTFVVFLTL